MKRLNYSTQLIDDAKRNPTTIAYLENDPQDGETFLRLVRESQKFMLPDKGHLLYGPGGLPEGLKVLRLPYPVISIETTWNYEDTPEYQSAREKFEEVPTEDASRRLVLAFEVSNEIYDYLPDQLPDGELDWNTQSAINCGAEEGGRIDEPVGYVVTCAFRADAHKAWAIIGGGFFVPYEQDLDQPASWNGEKQAKNNRKIHKAAGAKLTARQMKSVCAPLSLLHGLFSITYGIKQKDQILSSMMSDLGEEMRMVIELTTALSCTNVETQIDTPSRLLQRQRKKGRKAPLFDYHVLILNGQGIADGNDGSQAGNAKGSPRTHLRRGHLRRLPHREERVWINDTIVNPGNGFVSKDYSIQ